MKIMRQVGCAGASWANSGTSSSSQGELSEHKDCKGAQGPVKSFM